MHKSQQQSFGYMMYSSLLVPHIQKLVHVVRASNAVYLNIAGN